MRSLLLCLVLLVFCKPARAEIVCGLTLEWLADTCPYVGIYTCKHVSVLSSDCLQVEASLADKLRGVGPESVSFSYPNPSAQWNTGGPKPEIGDKFMVFFRDAGANDVRLEEVISLTKPIRGCELSAALEPDFSVLTDRTAIERVVKDRIAAKPLTPTPWRNYPDDRFRLEIPRDTAAYRAVFGGSSCFLIVPDDLLSISKAHLLK